MFQFTLPHGERQAKLLEAQRLTERFNSRSRMGSDRCPESAAPSSTRFNSRSRMGSDTRPARIGKNACLVSIHAPAWGATPTLRGDRDRTSVSIHAPAWGATPPPSGGRKERKCFNSRSRMGSDASRSTPLARCAVSIHAPAWGATDHCRRPRRGSRFQFTLPHGERLAGNKARGCGGLFPVLRRV